MTPTVADAQRRALVHMDDGRTARLLRIPAISNRRSAGAKARIVIPSGAVVSVPVDQIVWVYAEGEEPA